MKDYPVVDDKELRVGTESFFVYHCATAARGPRPPHRGFMITPIRTTLGSTPLDE